MAFRMGVAKAPLGRSKVRDKRLTHPTLYIDLRDQICKTTVWAPDKLIVSHFDGRIATGDAFSGVMKMAGDKQLYLFDAKAVRVDEANRKLAASFDLLSPEGRTKLETIYEQRDPEGKKPLPALLFSMAYKTVNWSLSGFLLGEYHGQLKVGQHFSGMVRLEKTDRAALFRAEAKRFVSDCHGLGAQFDRFDADTFELFELAMKKSSEGPR